MLVVIRPDPASPVIRFNRYDLTTDPNMGTGRLLAEIHAHIHRRSDPSTETVTIDWTAHLIGGADTGRTHPSWDDAYTDLLTLLSGDPAPART